MQPGVGDCRQKLPFKRLKITKSGDGGIEKSHPCKLG